MRAWVVALAALVVLAGCTDEREAFRDDLRPLEERAEEQRSVISGLLRSLRLGSREDAGAVRAHAAKLSSIHDQIAALDPPGDYEDPFGAYVQANRAIVGGLRRFAAELERGNLAGVRRQSRRVVADLSRAHRASLRWLE